MVQPILSRSARLTVSIFVIGLVALACNKGRYGDEAASNGTKAPANPSMGDNSAPKMADTSKGAPAGASGDIALGDKIFHGKAAGGTCFSCHGQNAKGTSLAPDLTDTQWLNTDGSLQGIAQIITNGVPKPKQHQAGMPPMGGAKLTPEQIQAVAAYVYSLSHKS